MTLGEIIKKFRAEHEMSMDAFSALSGMSKSYISLLERNRHPKTGKPIAPSIQSIKQAADGMGMDFNILFGMLDGDVSLSEKDSSIEQHVSIPEYDNISPIETRSFPVLGSVACGEPILMDDRIELYVKAGSDVRADFVLHAKGDSMIGARIYDGDLVFVRQQPTVENGEIAVVAIDDEAVLKRFYKYGDDLIVLRSENPEYKDMEFRPDDGKDIHVLGRALFFQSDIR